jgi:hypothetical protein
MAGIASRIKLFYNCTPDDYHFQTSLIEKYSALLDYLCLYDSDMGIKYLSDTRKQTLETIFLKSERLRKLSDLEYPRERLLCFLAPVALSMNLIVENPHLAWVMVDRLTNLLFLEGWLAKKLKIDTKEPLSIIVTISLNIRLIEESFKDENHFFVKWIRTRKQEERVRKGLCFEIYDK